MKHESGQQLSDPLAIGTTKWINCTCYYIESGTGIE